MCDLPSLEHQDSDPEETSQPTGNEIGANDSSDAHRKGIGITTISIQPPNSPQAAEQSADKPDWRKDITLCIEALGLAALIVYTVFSILQWAQIRYTNRLTARALDGSDKTLQATLNKLQGQIDEAHGLVIQSGEQVAQAKSALRQSKEQFIEDQRPYLWLDDDAAHPQTVRVDSSGSGPNSGKLASEFTIKNYGKSAAMRVHSVTYISAGISDPENDIHWDRYATELRKGAGGIYLQATRFTRLLDLKGCSPEGSHPCMSQIPKRPRTV